MTDEQLLIQIGSNISRIRKERGYTIIHLAEMCNMEKSNLIPIEKGRRNVTAATLNKISTALGIDISELFKPM